jgi:hypothetical protein
LTHESCISPYSSFIRKFRPKLICKIDPQEKEKVPNRPKTPLVDTRYFLGGGNKSDYPTTTNTAPTPAPLAPFQRNDITRASLGGNTYFASPQQQQQQPQQQQQAGNYYNALPDQMNAMNLGYNYQVTKTFVALLQNSITKRVKG